MRCVPVAVLVFLTACGIAETHFQINSVSGCITKNCSDTAEDAEYRRCEAACRKQYSR